MAGTAPGDHLQSAYRLWLPGHQLQNGRAPWLDPYSFRPAAEPRPNFAAWPFGLPYWPLHRLLGAVGAWNTFVLLGYLAAAAFAFLWLRALNLGRGAALVGAAAFALAPYLVGQSASGHLLAWSALCLPLALWAWERGWAIAAALALGSIPLSGQVHLALAAIPFFLLYAGRDSRRRRPALLTALASAGAGLLVYTASIRGTVGAGGRSFTQVERYSAELGDFVSRGPRAGLESLVFLGWATPLLALAGLAVLVAARRFGLALALGLGALVPVLLALGANLPGYEALWGAVPGLEHTRVPTRLLPVAALSFAGLVAFAVQQVRHAAVPILLVPLVFLDLGVDAYRTSAANEHESVYATLRAQPAGRLLELPVFLPDRQEGSVYLLPLMRAPRERPGGYSTTAPRKADSVLRRLRRAACGDGQRFRRLLLELDVSFVVAYPGPGCIVPKTLGRQLARDGGLVLYSTASTRP